MFQNVTLLSAITIADEVHYWEWYTILMNTCPLS